MIHRAVWSWGFIVVLAFLTAPSRALGDEPEIEDAAAGAGALQPEITKSVAEPALNAAARCGIAPIDAEAAFRCAQSTDTCVCRMGSHWPDRDALSQKNDELDRFCNGTDARSQNQYDANLLQRSRDYARSMEREELESFRAVSAEVSSDASFYSALAAVSGDSMSDPCRNPSGYAGLTDPIGLSEGPREYYIRRQCGEPDIGTIPAGPYCIPMCHCNEISCAFLEGAERTACKARYERRKALCNAGRNAEYNACRQRETARCAREHDEYLAGLRRERRAAYDACVAVAGPEYDARAARERAEEIARCRRDKAEENRRVQARRSELDNAANTSYTLSYDRSRLWDMRAQTRLLINAYNNVWPGPDKRATCLLRTGNATSVCDALRREYDRYPAVIQNIYTPSRMTRIRELGTSLKDNYRSFINQSSLSAERKALLLQRLNKIEFVAPTNHGELENARKGNAIFRCVRIASPPPVECEASQIIMGPQFAVQADTDALRERMLTIVAHEMGHGLALNADGGDPIFGTLGGCLADHQNYSRFNASPEVRATLHKEGVADWLASKITASYVAGRGTASGKKESFLRTMYTMGCGVLYEGRNGLCNGDGAGRFAYPDAPLPAGATDAVRDCRSASDHPTTPDRFTMFMADPDLKRAAGCPTADVNGTTREACTL